MPIASTIQGVTPTTHVLLTSIGDPDGERTITSFVALLVAMGLALVMVAVWLWRSTRPDPALLAPLEVMGERKWRRADPVAQRRMLDDYRPDDAEPLSPAVTPPDIDEAFERGPTASGFDDLHDAALPDAPRHPNAPADWLRSRPAPQSTGGRPDVSATPRQLDRPGLDEFGSGDIDPALLAAAKAEIDAELLAAATTPEDGSGDDDAQDVDGLSHDDGRRVSDPDAEGPVEVVAVEGEDGHPSADEHGSDGLPADHDDPGPRQSIEPVAEEVPADAGTDLRLE